MSIRKCILLLPLVILLLFAVSCEKKNADSPPSSFLIPNTEYTVGIKTLGLETKGILIWSNDEVLSFTVQDENSLLFGLKESISSQSVITEYHGIRWESEEVSTALAPLHHLILHLTNSAPLAQEKESYHGQDAVKYSYRFQDESIFVWRQKSDNQLLCIKGQINGADFEVNFGTE